MNLGISVFITKKRIKELLSEVKEKSVTKAIGTFLFLNVGRSLSFQDSNS